MYEMIEANWLLILIAFLIGVAIAWYIFNVRRKTRVIADRRDVLDEGAERAKRNQAFLDAPTRSIDDGTAFPRASEPSPQPARTPEPRGTASILTPGAIFGAETAVNAAAGTPAQIGRAEQEEADAFRGQEGHPSVDGGADAPSAPQTNDDAATPPLTATSPEKAPSAPVVPAVSPLSDSGIGAPGGQAPARPAEFPDRQSADELTRLKGVGPKLAARLNELGITQLDQIAAWEDADIDRIDPQLGRFQGRIRRDEWVTQARLLTAGDQAAYEEKFGRL